MPNVRPKALSLPQSAWKSSGEADVLVVVLVNDPVAMGSHRDRQVSKSLNGACSVFYPCPGFLSGL